MHPFGLGLGLGLGSGQQQPFDPSLYTWVGADAVGTRDGTFDNPWETLMDAEAAAGTATKPIIYVKAGTYIGTHIFTKAYDWRTYGAVTLQTTARQVVDMRGELATSLTGFTIDAELGGAGTTTVYHAIKLGIANENCKNKTFNDCTLINPKLATRPFITDVADANTASENTNIVFNSCTINGTGQYMVTFVKHTIGIAFNNCALNYIPVGSLSRMFKIDASISEYQDGKINLSINGCAINVSNRILSIGKKGTYSFTNNVFTHTADFTEANAALIMFSSTVGNSAGAPVDDNALIFNDNTVNGSTYTYGDGDSGYIFLRGTSNIYFNVTAKRNNIVFNNIDIVRAFIRADNMLSYDITDNYIEMQGNYQTGSPSPARGWHGLIRAGFTSSYKKMTGCTIARNTIISLTCLAGAMIKWGNEKIIFDSEEHEIRDVQDGAIIRDNYLVGAGAVAGNGVHAIFCGFNKDNKVYYNKLIGCGSIGIKGTGAANDYEVGGVRYNIIINTNYGLVAEGVSVTFANNTIIQTDAITRQLICAYALPYDENPTHYNPTLTLYNNAIIVGKNNSKPVISKKWNTIIVGKVEEMPIVVQDYNAYDLDDTDAILVETNDMSTVTPYTMEEWDDIEGQTEDLHSLPLITDINTATGIPEATSNVLGEGVTIAGDGNNEGLNISSVFPTAVVVKEQDEDWDIGAYVR